VAQLQLDEVQGNVFGGFMKDHQAFLMFEVRDAARGARWIRERAADDVATSAEVLRFNALFKHLRARRGERAIVKATWMNIAFTRRGLELLAAPGIARMDEAFAARSVAERARTVLGDGQASAPEHWNAPYRDDAIHVVVIVAADDREDLWEYAGFIVAEATVHGFALVALERGNALPGALNGHEHFGYKDGVSQPRVQGVDHGENLLPPWDFVVNARDATLPTALPAWTHQGSYLVFRRLRQDVPSFQRWEDNAAPAGIDADRFGAKVVGRYEDGAPYERVPNCAYDPDAGEPTSHGEHDILRPEHINDFGYLADEAGLLMPHAAHIRKVNPRGSFGAPPIRIIRRGIAYGAPYDPVAVDDAPGGKNADRGLLFAAYQASIARQFELIQQMWSNNGDFPGGVYPPPGQDMIVGQTPSGEREFRVPLPSGSYTIVRAPTFVTTTGTLYCFSPSIGALRQLGS
jgi:Dyp-type peroxidase family